MGNFTNYLRSIFSAALFFFFGMTALAQDSPPKIERPDIKVGDSWTYDHIDGWKKTKDYTRISVVTSVDENEIRSEYKRTDTGELNTLIRNRELNRLELEIPSGKNIVSPYYPNYSFPLDVGKTWEQKTTFTRNYENRKAVATLQGKVIGWEQVTVPAGTFRALKIELGGFYNGSNSSSNWSGQIFHTIWYVPEVKNFVKEIYRDTYRGVTSNHDIHELVEYKLSQ